MNAKKYNWDLSICNNKFLLCDQDIIDTKQDISERCSRECEKIACCHRIVELLNQKKPDEAFNLLD